MDVEKYFSDWLGQIPKCKICGVVLNKPQDLGNRLLLAKEEHLAKEHSDLE